MDGVIDGVDVVSNTIQVGGGLLEDGGGAGGVFAGGRVEEGAADGAALEELLKGVVVGEESYKTPKKGFSSVAISVEIEEYVEVEVGLPPPANGMVFQSWEELDEYFREFGKQNGFGVVRTSACKVGKGPNAKLRRNCLWTCECYGLPDRKRKKVELSLVTDAQIAEDGVDVGVRRRSKKVQCPVNVYANVNERGEWVIQRAELKHGGHNPTPGKAKNISRLRKKFLVENPHVVRQLFSERRAGVPVAKIYNKMARERNGVENMPFAPEDLHQEVAKQKKQIFEEGDAKAMFAYFESMVEDNSNFFYTYRVDDDGRLKDVLWVDARCRMAYEEFGDVVCFDSTYLTNEYKLPFCNFVGVNHHGQTILFGCALVSRETSETFEWVYSNWLRCMQNKAPVAILTDQDPAMRKALKSAMKGTTHRWCIWHILQKFSTKLGKHPKYPELKVELESAVYDSLDCEEFEMRWPAVIKKYNCEADEWLEGLYMERDMWIPAYVKHLFWAGMKTTQRVESIHSFFDGYLSRHTLLCEFVERYCEALEVRASSEKRADDNNSRFVRQPMTAFPAESVFRKIYTDAKFKEVQRECTRLLYVTGLEKKQVSENVIEHVLEDIVWWKPNNSRKEVPSQRKRVYKVTYNSSTKEAECECRYFNCHGIICRHMIMVYQMNDCREIPDKYILRRWRKDVIRKHTRVKVKYHDPSKTEAVCRFDKMMVKFSPICSKASICKRASDVVLNGLQLLDIQVEEKLSTLTRNRSELLGCNGTPSSVCLEKEATAPDTEKQGSCAKDLSAQLATIKDPQIPKKPPHRTTDSRYKSCVEKKTQGRQGKRGAKKDTVVAAGVDGSASQMQLQSISTHQEQNVPFPMMGYSPHGFGGIQMTDGDGSLGYFTSLSGVQRPSIVATNSPSQRPFYPPYIIPYQQYCHMQGMMQMGYMSPNTAVSQTPLVRPPTPGSVTRANNRNRTK